MLSPTILVVEDDPSLRLLIRLAIEPRGYQIVEAGDGEAGIALARSFQPDLVVVDVRLPDCDGIEIARSLRSVSALSGMPILMMAGKMQPSDRLAAEDAGVDSLIDKPFSIETLVFELDRLLSRRAKTRTSVPVRRVN